MNTDDVAAMAHRPLSLQYPLKYRLTFLAVSVLFLALVAGQLYSSYTAAQAVAATDAQNLARVLEARLAADFEAARNAVLAMASEIDPAAMRPSKDNAEAPRIAQQLKARVRHIRSASALRYFDAKGDVLYSSVDNTQVNIADRSYFRQARDSRSEPVIYSDVLLNRVNHRPTLMVAKALRDQGGQFLGIATAAIDLPALREEFAQIELGAGGTVVLRRLETGAPVVIYPGPMAVDNAPAPDIPLRRAILRNGPSGAIEFVSPVDGIQRLYGYRTLSGFPFFVAVGISEHAYLAEWRRLLARTSLGSALFLALLAAVFMLLARAGALRERIGLDQRRYRRRLEGIVGALSEGLLFQDKRGIVVDANPAAELLLGLGRHELLGKDGGAPFRQAVHEDHSPVAPEQHPAMVALRSGRPVRNQVMGIMRAGCARWLSVSSAPIFSPGKEAAPDFVVTTFSDVTERKLAETELRIAATAFQSREGIMVTDRHGVILRVNQAFTDITGYAPEQVIGRSPRLLRSGRHDPAFYRDMWDCIHATGSWQGEIADRRRNGDVCPIWLTISAVKDPCGAVTHFVATHADITERKNAEIAMLKLNRELHESRQHLRGLAAQSQVRLEQDRKHIAQEVHDELGQVLTALRMELSLVKMRFGALDPAVGAKVAEMKQLVDRAISGVRNVVVNLRPPALDMGVVPAIEWLCGEFTRTTGIDCSLKAAEQHIGLDETRSVAIFRIVQESLTNIARYAGASRVSIRLGLHGKRLQLQVRDNGAGFDLDAAAARTTFGLLGMRERALALGGKVDIFSAPGEGTRICVWIPIDLDVPEKIL